MADPAWFGPRLKQLREAAGLTQPELAERAGLSKAGVANLEQGRRTPGWDTVLVLAHALGATPNDFAQQPTPRGAATPGRPPKTVDCQAGSDEARKGNGKKGARKKGQ